MKSMKRRKGNRCLLAVCLALVLGGCGDSNAVTTSDSERILADLNEVQEESLDLENYSLEVLDTDPQIGLGWNRIAKAESGYYFWKPHIGWANGLLSFFDTASGQVTPLCNRPDCSHDSADCNAYFNAKNEEDGFFSRDYLQYYEGNIYVFGYDADGYMNLYKVAADGSTCETYMQLFKIDLTAGEVTFPRVYIYRGYVYYCDLREEKPRIYRMELGNDKKELVYESTEIGAMGCMEGYGDYLFFQEIQFTDDYEDYTIGFFGYNIRTQKIYLIKKNINIYAIQGDTIYYLADSEIRAYSLSTQEDALVVSDLEKSEELELGADEQYLYVFNSDSGNLRIYDYDGSLVEEIIDSNISNCYFGDGVYLFAEGTFYSDELQGNASIRAYLKASDIKDGKAEWKYFE